MRHGSQGLPLDQGAKLQRDETTASRLGWPRDLLWNTGTGNEGRVPDLPTGSHPELDTSHRLRRASACCCPIQ